MVLGTALWDGDHTPTAEGPDGAALEIPAAAGGPEQIAGSLAEFVAAVRSGVVPDGEIHSNIHSLAMVEAAVQSAESGQRVRIDDVIAEAYSQALDAEKNAAVKAALTGWGSPQLRSARRADAVSH